MYGGCCCETAVIVLCTAVFVLSGHSEYSRLTLWKYINKYYFEKILGLLMLNFELLSWEFGFRIELVS